MSLCTRGSAQAPECMHPTNTQGARNKKQQALKGQQDMEEGYSRVGKQGKEEGYSRVGKQGKEEGYLRVVVRIFGNKITRGHYRPAAAVDGQPGGASVSKEGEE